VRLIGILLTHAESTSALLVVDDDRAILTLIGTIALAEGFDVATTVSGEDAMKQLRHRPADLVLLDLRMPG
jgi:DNA-binding response OmpR family regulator